MLKDYVPAVYVDKVYYDLNFDDGCGNGFCFPCDANGNLLPGINEAAYQNYLFCMQHPERFARFKKVDRHASRERIPAHGVCDCGEEIELYDQYLAACECPRCGRWYNLFGQELLPPTEWENENEW